MAVYKSASTKFVFLIFGLF